MKCVETESNNATSSVARRGGLDALHGSHTFQDLHGGYFFRFAAAPPGFVDMSLFPMDPHNMLSYALTPVLAGKLQVFLGPLTQRESLTLFCIDLRFGCCGLPNALDFRSSLGYQILTVGRRYGL
jgi:hypothetical protein